MKPPLPTYPHHLDDALQLGTLSSLQIETVIYAFQRFGGAVLEDGSRPGFFLGDGAGVGCVSRLIQHSAFPDTVSQKGPPARSLRLRAFAHGRQPRAVGVRLV
jgi:hypothetical protein